MKKRYFIAIAVLAVFVILLWLSLSKTSVSPPAPAESSANPQAQSSTTNTELHALSTAPGMPDQSRKTTVANNSDHEALRRYIENIRADHQYDWKQPINFYGKVVDESNHPIVGANVVFTWNDLSPMGTSTSNSKSDTEGLFSIHETGKRISITLEMDGYYTPGNERGWSFEYANPGDGLFTPDAANPVVFHLRKKGIGADLITSQRGMSPDFPIHVPRDGTPVAVDLMNRKAGASGQMQVSESKPASNWQQATAWSFKMEIPDGGFVEENDTFPFQAPESGYQPVTDLEFQKGDANWTTGINKNYYIKFGNPPIYGRLQVQTGILYGGAILTYAINPDGTRNLEPK